MKQCAVDNSEPGNFRKHIRELATTQLQEILIIKSFWQIEPEKFMLCTTVRKAIKLRSVPQGSSHTIESLRKNGQYLWDEKLQCKKMDTYKNFTGFSNPPLLEYFLTHLLIDSHALNFTDVKKIVDVKSQFLVQNIHNDCQVHHQPKKDDCFWQADLTPFSIGLPLAVHSGWCGNNSVRNLSEVYIGSQYKKTLYLKKDVEQGVSKRMTKICGFVCQISLKEIQTFDFLLTNWPP